MATETQATALTSNEKIKEALKLLNEAAGEKREALQELVGEGYGNLKDAIMQSEHTLARRWASAKARAAEAALRAKEVTAEKAKEVAHKVDTDVHQRPWTYIGAVAVGALLLGYVLGRRH